MSVTLTRDYPRGATVAPPGYSQITGRLAFDNSYSFGGESITGLSNRFKNLKTVTFEQSKGYTFEYDFTNNKVKVFAPAPPIVYEEVHTIASNAITLDYPAAALINIASATQSQLLIEPSDTLAANECQLAAAMAEGTRPTINFHADTSGAIKVTYITQAWREVWVNRQASAAVTVTTHVGSLGAVACFVESCLSAGTTPASRYQFVRGGDAVDGNDECEIDFTDAGVSGYTTLTFNAAAAITSAKVTYITKPASGFLNDRFLEDQDTTMSSGVSGALTPARPILFQSICSQVPDYTAANERDPHYLQMPEADALGTTGEFYIRYGVRPSTGITNHIAVNDTSSDAVSLTYVYGVPEEIPGLVPLEVKNGTNLSHLTAVRFIATGDK